MRDGDFVLLDEDMEGLGPAATQRVRREPRRAGARAAQAIRDEAEETLAELRAAAGEAVDAVVARGRRVTW